MQGKTLDVTGGLKVQLQQLKEEQAKEENSIINMSIKIFDNEQEIILSQTDVTVLTQKKLDEVLAKYIPRGQTALRDALGDSINYYISNKLLNPHIFDSCIIYVMTDGLENCSKNPNYAPDKLKEIIKKADEEHNIKIFYVGSNQDSIMEAGNIGISASQAINYAENEQGNKAVFRSLANAAMRVRSMEADIGFTGYERQESVNKYR